MGCNDRESNFQRTIFEDGKWWATWGLDLSWEGPVDELAKRFPEFHEPNFIQGDQAYAVERTGDAIALVKPLGHIIIQNF